MPDFYQKIELSSRLIKRFQFVMVLIEDLNLWITQKYDIGEDKSNLRLSEKNVLRSVSSEKISIKNLENQDYFVVATF